MYCSWLVFRPGLLGLETSGGGGFTGPGTAGIPVGAAAVVDILWQLSHLLSQQQLKEALLVEAWHPISGPNQALGLGGSSAVCSRPARPAPLWLAGPGSIIDAPELYRAHALRRGAWRES